MVEEEKCTVFSFLDYKLEIYYTLFFIAKHMSVPVTQIYIEKTIFLGANKQIQGCFSNVTETNRTNVIASNELVSQATVKVMETGTVELLLSVPVVLLMGIWSDARGMRKPLLWLPSLGLALYSLSLILENYFPTENFIGIFVGAAIHGLTGNMTAFIVGTNAYVSDNIPLKWRTLRLLVLEILMNISLGVGNVTAGFWISSSGFSQPMWFLFAISILATMLIFFTLDESDSHYEEGKLTWNSIKNCVSLCSCKAVANKRLWAVFFAYQIFSTIHQGSERTRILFLSAYPLCFSTEDIGLFICVLALLGAFGTLFGIIPIKLNSKFVDTLLVITGLISTLIGTVLFACSTLRWELYLSSALMLFHALPYPTKRSISSKQVSADMQGSVYALLMSGQAVTMFIGPLLFNAIYASTLHILNGLVFILAAVLLLIPLGLMGYVFSLDFKNRHGTYQDMDVPGRGTTETNENGSSTASEMTNLPNQDIYSS